MSFNVIFHPVVAEDVKRLDAAMKESLRAVVRERLAIDPARFGKPLRGTLKGYWKLRVGDYRIVYGIDGGEVIVYAIRHRKEVYGIVGGRR